MRNNQQFPACDASVSPESSQNEVRCGCQAMEKPANQSHQPNVAWAIFIPLGILVLLGILLRLFVYDMTQENQWLHFAAAALTGTVGFVVLLRLNICNVRRYAWWLLAAFLLATLVIPRIWEDLYIHQIQRLFAYKTLQYLWLLYPIVYGLAIYRLRGTGFLGVLLSCMIFGVPFLLSFYTYFGPSLCESIGALGSVAVLLTAILRNVFSSRRWGSFAFVVLGTAFCIVMFCIIEPYRMLRILALWEPARDPNGAGWLVLRIREITGNFNLIGHGGALPSQAATMLRELGANTVGRNYTLLLLAYQYGALILLLPIGCITAFLILSIRQIIALQNTLIKMLCSGVVTVLAVQALLSLIACFGFPLWHDAFFPFLSYGSMAFFIDLLLAGALASLLRANSPDTDGMPKRRKLRIHFVDAT